MVVVVTGFAVVADAVVAEALVVVVSPATVVVVDSVSVEVLLDEVQEATTSALMANAAATAGTRRLR